MVTLTSSVATLSVGILYVWTNSPDPVPPYTTWGTAAHVIQDAVDAALPGDEDTHAALRVQLKKLLLEDSALKEALTAKETLIEELQGRLKKAGKEKGAAKEKIDVLLTRLDNLT